MEDNSAPGSAKYAGPSEAVLALLRRAGYDKMLQTYPEFCARLLGRKNGL